MKPKATKNLLTLKKTTLMDLEATKLELMQMLLNTQKEKVLMQIKEVFEREGEIALSKEQQQELNLRLEKYASGKMNFSSWEEAKERIRTRGSNAL